MTTTLPPGLRPHAYVPCGQAWPASLSDVYPLHCTLPHGHRSAEHWTPPLWRGHAGIVWADDPDD